MQIQISPIQFNLLLKAVQLKELITPTDKDNIKGGQTIGEDIMVQEHQEKVEIINSNGHIDLLIRDKDKERVKEQDKEQGKEQDKNRDIIGLKDSLRRNMVIIDIVTNRKEKELPKI